jgi:ketosteroid isomerase-like protein
MIRKDLIMTTTETKNIAIIDSYFKAIQTGDLQTLGALVSEDIIWHQPGSNKLSGTHQGASAVFGTIGGMMEESAGTFKIDSVQSIMANGSRVAAVLTFSGQRDGSEMSMLGVDIFTIEGGKITESWLYSADQPAEDAFWGQ